MVLASNNAATFDSPSAKLEILESLVKTAKVYAPVVQTYMRTTPSMGTRIEWFDQNLGNGTVTLSSAYTAGAGSMVISASSLVAPYQIKANIHQVQTQSGSATYNITAYNSGTNTLTITLAQGSDANLANGTTLFLIRDVNVGANANTDPDLWTVTSDYNYISNFAFTIKLANPNKNGQLSYHLDDLSFANQLSNLMPEAVRTLERRVIKDTRAQGSGAAARNGNTIQSGNGSRAGGIISLANARGLYTASSGSAGLSEDLLNTDMLTLRERGAFSKVSDKTRDMGLAYCKAFCSNQVIGDVNKLIRIGRDAASFFGPNDKIGGKGGTFGNVLVADGVAIEFIPSDGMADNEILYVPDDDLIEVRVLRMMEEQEPIPGGDNETRMYTVTYSTCVKSPWKLGYRSNLIRI